MTTRRSYKLTICVGLLAAFCCVPHALAGDEESAKSCPGGQKADDQEELHCCEENFLEYGDEGYKCVELPSSMNVAVALTLILSFTFLISLQCFMNHHDIDMREYAYTGISLTVSIFSAVLFFQSVSALVDDFVTQPIAAATGLGSRSTQCMVCAVHMAFWYLTSQFTIAYVSSALKPEEWREEQTKDSEEPGQDIKLDVEIKGICYGMLMAHVTGFASIRFWTELQQLEPVNTSPWLTLALVPICFFSQLVVQKLTDSCRQCYIGSELDWFEETWDEKCKDAEDDIMGLTLSVLIVNSLRFAINEVNGHKCLPNSEQEEEGEACEFQHTAFEALWLFAFGLLFVFLLFLTKILFIKFLDGEEEEKASEPDEDEEEEEAMKKRASEVLTGKVGMRSSVSKAFCQTIKERLEDVALTTLSMAYAWCVFHGTRQLLKTGNPDFLGQEENATTLAVVLAFGVTYIAWTLIRLLDCFADLPDEWSPDEIDEAIKSVIRGTSIFVGFAWEQTFDESIGQLSEYARRIEVLGRHGPPVAKLAIGFCCIGVVFLSWKWYILPFVFRKGWRFGYVFSKDDMYDRCRELAHHDEGFGLDYLHEIINRLGSKRCSVAPRFNTVDLARRLSSNGRRPSSSAGSGRSSQVGTGRSSQMGMDVGYRALPDSEVVAMRSEIEDLKRYVRQLESAQGNLEFDAVRKELETWRSSARQLEFDVIELKQQLAKERQVAEDRTKKGSKQLEFEVIQLKQQLANERQAADELKFQQKASENSPKDVNEVRLDVLPSGCTLSQDAMQKVVANKFGSTRSASSNVFPFDKISPRVTSPQARSKAAGFAMKRVETGRLKSPERASPIPKKTSAFAEGMPRPFDHAADKGTVDQLESPREASSPCLATSDLPQKLSKPGEQLDENVVGKGGVFQLTSPRSTSPLQKRSDSTERRRRSDNVANNDEAGRFKSPQSTSSPEGSPCFGEITRPFGKEVINDGAGRSQSPQSTSPFQTRSYDGELRRPYDHWASTGEAACSKTPQSTPPRLRRPFSGEIVRPSENGISKCESIEFKFPQSASPPEGTSYAAETMRPFGNGVNNDEACRFRIPQSATPPPKTSYAGGITRPFGNVMSNDGAGRSQSPQSTSPLHDGELKRPYDYWASNGEAACSKTPQSTPPRLRRPFSGEIARACENGMSKGESGQSKSSQSASPLQRTTCVGEKISPFGDLVNNEVGRLQSSQSLSSLQERLYAGETRKPSDNVVSNDEAACSTMSQSTPPRLRRPCVKEMIRPSDIVMSTGESGQSKSPQPVSPPQQAPCVGDVIQPSDNVVSNDGTCRFQSPQTTSAFQTRSYAGEMKRPLDNVVINCEAACSKIPQSTSPALRRPLAGEITRPFENGIHKGGSVQVKASQSASPLRKKTIDLMKMCQDSLEHPADKDIVDRFKSPRSTFPQGASYAGIVRTPSDNMVSNDATARLKVSFSASSLPNNKVGSVERMPRPVEYVEGMSKEEQFKSPHIASSPCLRTMLDLTGRMGAVDQFKFPQSTSLSPKMQSNFSEEKSSFPSPGRERPGNWKTAAELASQKDGAEEVVLPTPRSDCKKIHQGLDSIMAALLKFDDEK